ncbi:MAG: glycosyltransferase [Pleurocapsa sp. MO_226.B13]|nr:glycosyltransferase [Pleurocapsa sp. MO_226.B13]
MRIAFFVDQFPSLSETFILNQITGLIDRGYEVDIYCDREAYPKGNRQGNTEQMHPEVTKYQLLKRTYCIPIPVNSLWRCLKGIWLFLLNFHKAPKTILAAVNFRKYDKSLYGELADWFKPLYLILPLLEQPPYDIIHCHYGRNGLKAILLKDLGAIDAKIITAFHGYDISFYLKRHGENVYNYLFQRADLFQPISHFWAKKLIALGCNPEQISVHHMGVDCNKFMPSQGDRSNSESILIVSVARLVEKKGLTYGIEAVARLITKYPQLKLHYQIIGDGILKRELEQQIEHLGVAEQVKLLGWKEQQEVRAIIARADLLLAPSITSQTGDCEGIPVSSMEAMARAIPVVSTYHSGIPELVEDGVTGYLVAEKDVRELTDKLEHLVNDPHLRQQMGLAGREKVLNEYNIERLCDRLSETYQQLSDK